MEKKVLYKVGEELNDFITSFDMVTNNQDETYYRIPVVFKLSPKFKTSGDNYYEMVLENDLPKEIKRFFEIK
jgi:hypothetical protein